MLFVAKRRLHKLEKKKRLKRIKRIKRKQEAELEKRLIDFLTILISF